VRTAAILPVKRFADAKQRLGATITDPLRRRLAQAMVEDVLVALDLAAAVELTIVVTSEPAVARQARARGALVLEDTAAAGQSAAVMLGVARAIADGFARVLCVPGDCPALEHGELDALLGAREASGREVLIVPDRHGTGTNGLLLTPADVIAPSFGPGSCARHRALAEASGASWLLAHPPSLLLDVDTGADLTALRARLAGATVAASRTRSVLGQPARHPTLSTLTSGW
jgi:2-phospho-L-lactate guanylyltransferase